MKSPKQIQEIIPKRNKEYWKNASLPWICNEIKNDDYKLSNMSIADFILEQIPNYDINRAEFELYPQDDIKIQAEIDQIQTYCNTILHIYPINPSFPCFYPPFMNGYKFDQLISFIIPDECIKTSNKSYTSILSPNKTNNINPILTIITFNKIYPGFIFGGGQFKVETSLYFGENNINLMNINMIHPIMYEPIGSPL